MRRLGYRLLGHRLDYLLLLRPRQWPILTVQLAVGVLASPALPWITWPGGRPERLLLAWLAWVVGLNGGTLAYNSAWDRDEESIAYLDDPPPPPPGLARFALVLMLAGVGVAAAVSPTLAVLTGCCVLLSVLYSHPRTRAKGIPGLDLLINMVGYGGGTTLAGLAVAAAAASAPLVLTAADRWLCAGFALLFGSFYPLTQIYQLDADRRRGDRTLAVALGVRRSLLLAMLLGAGAAWCLLRAGACWGSDLLLLGIALVLWLALLVGWLGRAGTMSPVDHARGMKAALWVWAVVDLAVVGTRFCAPGAGW